MKKNVNIAVIGLGQIGIYLYNELQKKKKLIELKTGKKIKIVGISARNKNKKRRFTIDKKIFFSNPLDIIKKTNVDILFESIGLSDGISKKIVETALKNKIHVITPNKALIAKHGDYLSSLAEKNNVNLEFEAAVAGGIPILRNHAQIALTNLQCPEQIFVKGGIHTHQAPICQGRRKEDTRWPCSLEDKTTARQYT